MDTRRAPHRGAPCGIELSRGNETKRLELECSLRDSKDLFFTVSRSFGGDPHGLWLGTLLRVVRWTHAALRIEVIHSMPKAETCVRFGPRLC
jgi:hypothetical protein